VTLSNSGDFLKVNNTFDWNALLRNLGTFYKDRLEKISQII